MFLDSVVMSTNGQNKLRLVFAISWLAESTLIYSSLVERAKPAQQFSPGGKSSTTKWYQIGAALLRKLQSNDNAGLS